MKIQTVILAFAAFSIVTAGGAHAKAASSSTEKSQAPAVNLMDELDPFDPNIEQKLKEYDREEELKTGMPSHIDHKSGQFMNLYNFGCMHEQCPIYVVVSKGEQNLYLYINGRLEGSWPVSTGVEGRNTPNLDTHPDGRIYDEYTSVKFPGGDYNGLGNMPYAVFISGGIAIHGTPEGNWPRLGHRASHGCVRVHPDHAFTFNRLVRQYGVDNVWVTIQD